MNEFDDGAEEVRSYVRSRMRGDLPPQFVEDVMHDVNRTPQRGRGWMSWPMVAGLATVAAAIAMVAISLSVIDGNQVGSDATPSPSPALLARGSFVTVRGAVELEATGEGSSVTGRMTVSEGGYAFTVDLQCARTTEDGLIMIGGVTTDDNGSGLSPEGTWAGVVLKRGSPVQAAIWSQRGGGTSAASCLAYLDERFNEKLMDPRVDDDDPGPIEGTVELGPGGSGSGGSNATPPGPRLPLLARGVFAIAGSDVTLAAIAEGSSVTGRMYGLNFDVDLQCTRTTEDGLIMIGGVATVDNGSGTELSPEGTWAGIVLKRGSPVQATIWSQRDGPASQAASCLAYLDEQLLLPRNTGGVRLEPIDGFVELGANATLSPSAALLARGNFVTRDGAVELEATGAGSSVTGHMTVGDFTVDLQCSQTTEDGLIMIGGYTVEGSGLAPAGTQAAIFIERGPPVQAAIWSQRGGDTSGSPSCLAFLDDQLKDQSEDGDFPARLDLIEGTLELGP